MAHAYDGSKVIVTFGPILIEGYGEGDDVVQVEHSTPVGSTRVGIGGQSVVSIMHDESGTVRVRLLRVSKVNDQLSAALRVFRTTKLFLPLFVKDPGGRELHSAEQAYIAEHPSSQHGGSVADIEWVFNCPKLESYQGGY